MRLRAVTNFSLLALLLTPTAQASGIDSCKSNTSIAHPDTTTHNYEPDWSKAFREGYLKYNQEDYLSAKEYFTKAKGLGFPKAQHFLHHLCAC
jgi:hypothetical protein